MSGLSALIIGATGATGKHLLRELLQSEIFTRVGEYGRRVTPIDGLPHSEKLEQHVIDFDKIEAASGELKNGRWDVVFVTFGIFMGDAGSPAAFEKIDRQYVLDFARAAKSDDPSHKQRVVYLSSGGANSQSRFLYMRSKGLTEVGLAGMGYELISFRPGYLAGAERAGGRPASSDRLYGPIFSFFSHLTSSLQINVATLAKAIRKAGELGSAGIPPVLMSDIAHDGFSFTTIGNRQALDLAKLA